MKENLKSARDTNVMIQSNYARYKCNNSMKENPESARDTNITIK